MLETYLPSRASYSRRWFLKFAGLAGVSAIVAACDNGTPTVVYGPPNIPDSQIVVDFAKKTGVEIDPYEQKLWSQAYQKISTVYPVNDSSKPIMHDRLTQTVDLMGQSHIPYIQNAANILVTDSLNGIVTFEFVSAGQMITANRQEKFMSVGPRVENKHLTNVVDINTSDLLNNSDGIATALALTHETTHILQYRSFVNSLPVGLSPDEQSQELQEHLLDHNVQQADEASAYAVQSLATIELLRRGVGLALPDQYFRVAAEYIRCGADATSQCWLDFANTLIVN